MEIRLVGSLQGGQPVYFGYFLFHFYVVEIPLIFKKTERHRDSEASFNEAQLVNRIIIIHDSDHITR